MAVQPEFSRKWSWKANLQAYDDGLGEGRQPNQKLLFSSYETRMATRAALIESLKDGTARGTTNLPTPQELDNNNPRARLGLWVGWYLPLEPSTEPHMATRSLSISDLVEQKASKDQSEAVAVSRNCPTALKAIFPTNVRKRLDYFALAEPDPMTGICKAFQITGATKSIYFFPEFRDQADDITDPNKRIGAWKASILGIAGRKNEGDSDDDGEQDDEDDGNGGSKDKEKANKSAKQKSGKAKFKSKSGVRMPGTSNSAVAGAGIGAGVGAGVGAGNSLGFQTLHNASTAPVSALNPIDASQIAKLRAGLAELRSKMTLKLYNEIRDEVGKLTKVEFPVFPSSTYLDAFIRKKRLKKRHAKLAVDEFFGLYPFLRRESLTNLNHFLVHVASIALSSDTEGVVVLSWDIIQDFLLTLAYLCDARYAEEPELKRKVFLAFEMVRKEVGALSQSKEATPRDRIQDFLSGVIDNMDRQLVVHAENCRLAASLGEGTHTTGAAIVERWVKRLREQTSNVQEAARPFKRLRQLVDDDDDANDLPETEIDGSGSFASSNGGLAAAGSTGDSAGTPSHQHAEGESLGSSSRPAPDDFHGANSHIAEPSTVEVKPSGPGTPPGTPNSDSHLSDPESLVTGPGSPKDPDSLAVLQLLNAA
ncbi:hypothetical protein GCG54_00004059 [Colletotrichum gloeosporioides]|uniref:Uncharacterized protein n=1 Tax=Colletotrichum gloeosporioides TaxID=474922 RepID=A0A8H4CIV1_COLGL|nr:uncharacterized protein GCG54_00004059 [Colletotrichum gloeosporioides]KAF3804790.1 hypothetical protein GCG54_00004059 [Colletotrichum gloeosporioides]